MVEDQSEFDHEPIMRTVLLFFLALASVSFLQAADLPAGDKAKIEGLITHVQTLRNASFIRNGKEYDSSSAAKFLRAKWEANEEKIHSPSDFIAQVATKSSTTGKPYLIRFKDGAEVPCGKYLTDQLRKGEGAAPAKP
jgi:hypothetical protein